MLESDMIGPLCIVLGGVFLIVAALRRECRHR